MSEREQLELAAKAEQERLTQQMQEAAKQIEQLQTRLDMQTQAGYPFIPLSINRLSFHSCIHSSIHRHAINQDSAHPFSFLPHFWLLNLFVCRLLMTLLSVSF